MSVTVTTWLYTVPLQPVSPYGSMSVQISPLTVTLFTVTPRLQWHFWHVPNDWFVSKPPLVTVTLFPCPEGVTVSEDCNMEYTKTITVTGVTVTEYVCTVQSNILGHAKFLSSGQIIIAASLKSGIYLRRLSTKLEKTSFLFLLFSHAIYRHVCLPCAERVWQKFVSEVLWIWFSFNCFQGFQIPFFYWTTEKILGTFLS